MVDIQWLREIHFLVMFGFWMFFIHHLYTAILVSIEEENGVMESIFSGYKFVPEQEMREAIAEESDEDAEVGPEAMVRASAGWWTKFPIQSVTWKTSLSSNTVVIGVGNTILSDEGVGVHAARLLDSDPRVPAGMTILDGGTIGLELIPYASDASRCCYWMP